MAAFRRGRPKLTIDINDLPLEQDLSSLPTVRASSSAAAASVTPSTQHQSPNVGSPQQLSFTNPFDGSINIRKTGEDMVPEAANFAEKIKFNKKMYDKKRYNDYLNGTLNIILKSFCHLSYPEQLIMKDLLVFDGETYRFLTKEEHINYLKNEYYGGKKTRKRRRTKKGRRTKKKRRRRRKK